MPIHDWTKVDAGLFHAFHHRWIDALTDTLNDGLLPEDHYALPEQRIPGPIPDVLTLRVAPTSEPESPATRGGMALADAPVRTTVIHRQDPEVYGDRANYITIRHRHGEVVAVIEIVSPGNKGAVNEFRRFIEKADQWLHAKVSMLIIDLFPPGRRDPFGIHAALWDDEYHPPAEKPLAVAAYDAHDRTAYVEPLAIGDVLPEMPVFLRMQYYVPVPLEATYQTAWRMFPKQLKSLLA